jgi:hypothetical protein
VRAIFLGIIPGTAANVSLATVGQAMTLDWLWNPLEPVLFLLELAITVTVCWTIDRRVQTMLMGSGQVLAE